MGLGATLKKGMYPQTESLDVTSVEHSVVCGFFELLQAKVEVHINL